MKTYIKFLCYIFLKSFFYVFLVMLSLVFILNILSELEFFKDIDVGINFTLFLSLLNSPSMIFEMFPFIFLITTQFFFIKLFNNNELEVFKYSGLKNSSILWILSLLSLTVSVIIITVFYNFSANFKNFYLEKKSQYTSDGKYLAVITKNGLWIKDEIDDKIYIINSSEIKDNFLINNFITEFNDNYEVIRNLQSKKIDIKEKIWSIYNAKIYKSDLSGIADSIHINQHVGLTQLINIDKSKTKDVFVKKQKPVLWNIQNQITGDSIHLISNVKTENLDSLKVFNNAFVINKDSLGDGYNQISGKKLFGLFKDNSLSTIDIIKNAETLYYLRNEYNELVGIDKSKSGAIKIWLSNNAIDEMKKTNQIGGKTYPELDFPENEKIIRGFNWRESERPISKLDLFKDDPPLVLKVIKGLDAYIPPVEFFDSNLLDRVEKAQPKTSTKKNKKYSKNNNKSARKIPKSLFKNNN